MRAFGPVPSRRLGRSLGVNNIPPKVCTYSCVYCQVGRTTRAEVEPSTLYEPEDLASEVRAKVERARRAKEDIDYITFVPDGEPTLDANLGREIELLRPLGVKIAVISNASLIWRSDVRETLALADWVSLKVDAADEAHWRRINRPHRALALGSIFQGMIEFAKSYQGKLVTETMLVRDLNDDEDQLKGIAGFLSVLEPSTAYLSVPTRPPTEEWVALPDSETINRAYQLMSDMVSEVELLIGYEGNAFAFTGNVEEDLLSITAVHPMTEEAVAEFLGKANADEKTARRLVEQGRLIRTSYRGQGFYLRAPLSSKEP
jgi:wyosine [tRNA(Phe)-imidazoG37] synthetase (radical SAM superfamily)